MSVAWVERERERQADEQVARAREVARLLERTRAGVVYAERPRGKCRASTADTFPDPRLIPRRLAAEPLSRQRPASGTTLAQVDELLGATVGVTALGLMVRAIHTGILMRVFDSLGLTLRGLGAE